MNLKSNITAYILLFTYSVTYAQPTWRTYKYGTKVQIIEEKGFSYPSLEQVPIKEMKDSFYAAFTGKKQTLPQNCDLKGESSLLVGKEVLASLPLLTNSHKLQGWWITEALKDKTGNKQRYLTLHELNSYDNDTILTTKMFHLITKKYGRENIIPAIWYTGVIREMEQPCYYMGFTVSPYLSFTGVQQGIISEHTAVMEYSNKTNFDEAQRLKRIVADGHWLDRIDYEQIFFSHDVNHVWTKDSMKKYEKDSFSLLLKTEEDGNITIIPLLPKELTDNQKGLLAALQNVVNLFPKWCFRHLYTSDGRIFPGRYVYASYSSDSEWTFIDYFRFDPKAKGGINDFSPLSFFQKHKLEWKTE